MRYPRRIKRFCLLLLACGTLVSCRSERPPPPTAIDLPQIKERGKLIAITTYSATSYFIYRGQPMGYEYELLKRLADHLELGLEIVIAEDLDKIIDMLLAGEGDLIAHGLTVTKERKELLAFTEHHTTTRQVLVQRKPADWRQKKLHEIEAQLIRTPLDLIDLPVHVRRNSSYYRRLESLSEEIGGDIDIVPAAGDLETEELIRKVAEGEIDYTVADRNIALINMTYYTNLDVATPLSSDQRIAWAVRKDSPALLAALNEWILSMKKTTDYYVIYNKYFKNKRAFTGRLKSEFFSKTGGKISPYDESIKMYAAQLGWDWRLLAAMIYQESQFNAGTSSWAGAQGLMQMMPATAKQFGAADPFDPEQSLKAGVSYLDYLQGFWEEIPDSSAKLKFVLASYNVGENHVADARRLAQKYGEPTELWDGHVARYLLLKSNREYYNDDVVRYGYCRGEEPYNYVKEILERFTHYKKFISLHPDDSTRSTADEAATTNNGPPDNL